jgi:hypothetical protein
MLTAKASKINGLFKCIAVVDIPESAGASYRDIPAWKEQNGLSSEFCIACWGRLGMGNETYHLSTQLVGLMGSVDMQWGNVPFASPSNNPLEMDGMEWNGREVWLDHGQATYLDGNGIVNAMNFMRGWVAWGNRTGIYPGNTDPKDMWIPARRIFNWFANELILTYWQMVDLPIRGVLIDNIVSTINARLDGLTGAGYLNGGRVEWFADRNPVTDLINGTIRFHVFLAPPSPAETIEFWQEYDPSYLVNLASSLSA